MDTKSNATTETEANAAWQDGLPMAREAANRIDSEIEALGFAQLPEVVLRDRRLTDNEVRVLGLLLSQGRSTGMCCSSPERLARAFGSTETAVEESLQRLAELELISIDHGPADTYTYFVWAWRDGYASEICHGWLSNRSIVDCNLADTIPMNYENAFRDALAQCGFPNRPVLWSGNISRTLHLIEEEVGKWAIYRAIRALVANWHTFASRLGLSDEPNFDNDEALSWLVETVELGEMGKLQDYAVPF